MLFHDAATEFLRICAAERRLSEHTLAAYTADLCDLTKWLGTNAPLADISEAKLRAYLAVLTVERQLAASTVRRRFACLRLFFRYVSEAGRISDPFAAWRPKHPRQKSLPRALSQAETSSLLLSFKRRSEHSRIEPSLSIAVKLMVATGIRVGELCKLRVEDLSPDGSVLRVRGKGSRDRVVYVSDSALAKDLSGMARSRSRRDEAGMALFINGRGVGLQTQAVRSKLRRHAAEVGFGRRLTPHMLRHTAATLLIETGVDIRFVQRLLGHASIATTEIYTHVSDEALRSTLDRAGVLARLA